ncbi:MAG: TlpA family protein disulfide reductase, partial [Candidatus Hodarchaeales archaeon]
MVAYYYQKLSKMVITIIISFLILFNIFYLAKADGIMSEISPGELAPNFTVQNVFTNESLSLSDYYGKVVILDLFATWCQPCIEAMPFIYEILFSYNPSDLAIISIDVDSRESLGLIKSFAEEYNMAWYVTMDNENVVDSNYGTGYIPTMYIINQTGYVHYQEIGVNYDEVIASLDQL